MIWDGAINNRVDVEDLYTSKECEKGLAPAKLPEKTQLYQDDEHEPKYELT